MFKVILSCSAAKFLDGIFITNRKLFLRFMRVLDELSGNPYVAKALAGNLKGYYSYRVSDYRILFEIDRKKLLVYVEKITHRSIAYK
jgi:mRNA interferase RelE/StbE